MRIARARYATTSRVQNIAWSTSTPSTVNWRVKLWRSSHAQRSQDLFDARMVCAVSIEVFVANLIASADDEGRPDLPHPPARLVDVVSTLRRFPGCLPRARVQELEPIERAPRRRLSSLCIVIDEN